MSLLFLSKLDVRNNTLFITRCPFLFIILRLVMTYDKRFSLFVIIALHKLNGTENMSMLNVIRFDVYL
jgi:hypothetical protein